MQLLKQSTSVDVNFGPFIDETDFVSPLTGLSPSTSLSKNGAAYGAGPTGSHQSSGHYSITLSTTHTNTLGSLRVMCKASGALSVWRDFMVVPANVYDSLVGGSDTLQADVTQFGGTNGTFSAGIPDVNMAQISGDATAANSFEAMLDATPGELTVSAIVLTTPITANVTHIAGSAVNTASAQLGVNVVSTSSGAITATSIAADAIGASEFSQAAADKIWSSTTRTVSAATNITSTGGTVPITAGGLVSADMTAISTDTTAANSFEAMLDASPGDLTIGSIILTTAIAANVTQWASNTVAVPAVAGVPKVDVTHVSGDAGAADNLESFFDGVGYNASTSTVGTVTTATNVTTVNGIAANVVNASALATDAVAEIVSAVWDKSTSSHTTVGTFGQRMQAIRSATAQAGSSSGITLDASASSSTDFYKDQIIQITSGTGANQSRKITTYNGTSKVATVNPAWVTTPSSDSVFTIHPDGADTAASLTAAEVADAVWDELRAGHVISGSFGEYTLSDMVRISGDATAANSFEAMLDATPGDLTVNAIVLTTPIAANTTHWAGSTVATPTTAGVPEVDLTHIAGAAVNTSSAQLGVNVVSMAANTMTASALATDAVDEIWEYATTNIATAGGIGKLIVDNLNATVSSRSSHSAADVWAVATRVLTAPTNITSTDGEIPITAGGLVSCDVTAISTDTTAANNLEAALDGSGGVSITATFDGDLTGNVDGSVGSIAAGGIAAASFAAGAIDAAAIATGAIDADAIAADAIGSSELAASAATEIADAILSRNVSNVEASAGEHTLCTVVLGMLEWSLSGNTWTIKRTDGTTTHATKTTTDAAGDPITSVT